MKIHDAVRLIDDGNRLARDHIRGLRDTIGIIVNIERQAETYFDEGGRLDILTVVTFHGDYYVRAEHVLPEPMPSCSCMSDVNWHEIMSIAAEHRITLCEGCRAIWIQESTDAE
jgi:arabinogalactan endo-1,4-beta-galactosidase